MPASFQSQLLNFRKMKQDFSPQTLREGKSLFDKSAVASAKIDQFANSSVKITAQVAGNFGNNYSCEIEIDRHESEVVDSNCDCPHNSDCMHLACLIHHLEKNFEALVLTHFEGKNKEKVDKDPKISQLKTVLKHAEKKEQVRKEKELQKQDIQDYINSSELLGRSAYFIPEEKCAKEQGEIAFIFLPTGSFPYKELEVQLALRLPFRSKPVIIQTPSIFFKSLQTLEPYIIGNTRYVFGIDSFGPLFEELIKVFRQHLQYSDQKKTKNSLVDREGFGEILACAHAWAQNNVQYQKQVGENFSMPGLFWENLDNPILFSNNRIDLSFDLHYLTEPAPRLLLSPKLSLDVDGKTSVDEAFLLECSSPGLIKDCIYYRFGQNIKRSHLLEMDALQKMAIPEYLFGSFVENALPELMRFAEVKNQGVLEKIATLPQTDAVHAKCVLDYAQGTLEGGLTFVYGDIEIPENAGDLSIDQIKKFVTPDGVLARNLVEENNLVRDLFQGFVRDEKSKCFSTTNEKKIVEFMTEVVPRNVGRVEFDCPETLQSRFAYDDTRFLLSLEEGSSFDRVRVSLTIEGGLKGATVDALWDCVASRRTYIAIAKKPVKGAMPQASEGFNRFHKILVLQLEPLQAVLQVLDELQVRKIQDTTFELPLWILVNLMPERFVGLPLQVKLSNELQKVQNQIFDPKITNPPPVPKTITATLRHYQKDGIDWLSRLRTMGLNGILADDMGLGKTLQAITAISQYFVERKKHPEFAAQCLIVCPTSLVDNWKEEFSQFQPSLRVTTVTGTPSDRKKILSAKNKWDVLVTSYGLVQKDIEVYEAHNFGYVILDEAQAIKNRETRNARSVKKIPARHKLILTGTPLENSLEDLWSLFDFLMPGLLGSFERFLNSYIKPQANLTAQLEVLRRKISPFVLRRMKQDVLEDLPPISHIVYHCHLSDNQMKLYTNYAKQATEQLTKLVEKEGFDKVRIHVLATLTRLKQICCHPAIFAKEQAEPDDSSKYEMLLDLLGGLIESKHKTVIFSQYTKMLGILREDLEKMGTKFSYLDGSSKNRLQIVKEFNEDESIPLFLVSLKAGGSGLNLVGADTVIHYDMWWNPAVENQATDRVWRLGQKQKVSSYKLITLGTIEEKILELQERKKELLKEIVQTDEEVVSKLTWEEVLELLKI